MNKCDPFLLMTHKSRSIKVILCRDEKRKMCQEWNAFLATTYHINLNLSSPPTQTLLVHQNLICESDEFEELQSAETGVEIKKYIPIKIHNQPPNTIVTSFINALNTIISDRNFVPNIIVR